MRQRLSMVVGTLLLALLLMPGRAGADGSWLDGTPTSWNRPGMDIPPAPPADPVVDPNCVRRSQPPTTPEELAVAAAGWTPDLAFTSDIGAVRVVAARAQTYDDTCRPLADQTFIFADGQFAGSLSPEPYALRTDGALIGTRVFPQAQTVEGQYARYKPEDPACCPSEATTVIFAIDRTGPAPVLAIQSASTAPIRSRLGP